MSSDIASGFPERLRGKRILLATESLGPINGVSRTTQSLVDYLRANGVHVATVAPYYAGQTVPVPEAEERRTWVNKSWTQWAEAKSSSLASRGIGGGWLWHFDRDDKGKYAQLQNPALQAQSQSKGSVLRRSKSEDARRKYETARQSKQNPEYRLQGYPLPYNPDLTIAFPVRLSRAYSRTFVPDLIYLASPASVGFQFLVQLRQLVNPPPTMLNFQTDLSGYSSILFREPLASYSMNMLRIVQGFLFNAKCVHTIFYPSAFVRKYMESTGAPTSKMVQVGRGVDTQLFNPSCRDEAYRKELAPNGEIIFVCVSRLAPEKGFEFLAQVAIRLAKEGLDFKMLIVGGNKNPAVESEVHRYFQSLSDRIIFTGMLRGHALARAYAAGDIFLHCSITETFGLVVLESMASGVPVVARDEGGPSETVKHGKSGYLIPPHDLDAFVHHARRLADDKLLLKQMITQAREQALDTTWDKINCRVAMQMTQAIHASAYERRDKFKTSWIEFVYLYGAVGIVWIFWVIAVIPLLAAGFAHSLF